MDNSNFKIGGNEIPRYRYTAYRVESLIRRGHSLEPNVFFKHTFGDVRLKLICKGRCRSCKYFTENLISELQATEEKNKSKEGATLKPTVTVVHTQCYRLERERRFSDLVLLTDCNTKKVMEFLEKHDSLRIAISSITDIKSNVDILLERYVCGVLQVMVDQAISEHKETNLSIGIVPTSVSNFDRRALVQIRTGTKTILNNGLSTDFQKNTTLRQHTKDMCGNKRKVDCGSSGELRSGKRFRLVENTEETRQKLDTFLLDVIALYKRSDVPKSEWPRIQYPKRRSLNRKVVENLFMIDSTIVGCGYQHHILEIFLDRKANYSLDDAIVRTLKAHNILHYRFNYGPCVYTQLCRLDVGSELRVSLPDNGHREATLGGFAKYNVNVYALVSRHFAEAVENKIEYKDVNGVYTDLEVQAATSEGELDIAALKLVRSSVIKDTRFKDSRGTFVQSMVIDFRHLQENEVQRLLQGESIFAWTASSAVVPSIGRITIPIFKRPSSRHNYVVIENEKEEYANQGAVGPPITESFGKKGDSGASVCFDDREGKGVHVVSMLMGELKSQGLVGFLTLPLQQGLQQIGANLGGDLQLC